MLARRQGVVLATALAVTVLGCLVSAQTPSTKVAPDVSKNRQLIESRPPKDTRQNDRQEAGASAPARALTSDDLKLVRSELANLKSEQQSQIMARANSTIDFANNVIQWSAVFLTTFAIILALAGFLGFREVQAIRKRSHEIEALKEQFLTHLRNVEQLESRFDNQLRDLSTQFTKESQVFIEVSYNFNTATLAYNEGDNQKAIEYYTRALTLQPLNARISCRIGRAYTNLGHFQEAKDYFERALSTDPNNAEALRGLAAAYRYVDLSASIDFARRATEADPNDHESLDYLGLLYRDKMQIDDAIRAHQRARSIRARPETDFYLGLLYAYKRDMERARLMMQSANVALRDAQAGDRVRPLWSGVLRCGKSILENNRHETDRAAAEIRHYVTTPRIAEAVASHFTFFLGALSRQDELSSLLSLALPKEMQPQLPRQDAPAGARNGTTVGSMRVCTQENSKVAATPELAAEPTAAAQAQTDQGQPKERKM
jgi:tetratricopeptide (TPR) repeat protein